MGRSFGNAGWRIVEAEKRLWVPMVEWWISGTAFGFSVRAICFS